MKFTETIFLTGFPGFIAGRLVERLATADMQFLLLVQTQFVEKAMAEVEIITEKLRIPLQNFCILEGDISAENLGLSDEDLEFALAETNSVFHLAAVYDLAVSKDLAYKVNVDGTKNVNEFVKKIKGLRRYNYISTCYVAGKRSGRIFENQLRHNAGFRNFYEETKYLAEVEVEEMKENFPVTIFRPSVVCGDSETGETAKYDGIYYVINYLRKSPNLFRIVNIGNKFVRLNLVPVDFVVKAIAALARDPKAIGMTVQVADSNPMTTEELVDLIALDLCGKKSIVKLPPKFMQAILNLPTTQWIGGLPKVGVPYFFVAQSYDTENVKNLLAPHYIECPHFSSYVKKLIDFVEKNPKL